MATNPIPGYTFEHWLNGDPNIKWEDVGDFHGLFISGEITEEEFRTLENEGNKIYSAQFEAFDKLVEYNVEVFKDNFEFELKSVKREDVQTFKEIEIRRIEALLNQDIETYQLVLQDEKDFDGIDGHAYKEIITRHKYWKDNKLVFGELFVNQNLKTFSLYTYLKWLKSEGKPPLAQTLLDFFLGNPKELFIIMEGLTEKKIFPEDKTGILVREDGGYKWTYKGYGGKLYLAAFIYILHERGWLDLADEDDKPLSNEQLAKVITNSFGFKLSKESVKVIRSGKPDEKYLRPFMEISNKP